MRWTLVKAGGRRFRCLDCNGEDPLKSTEVGNNAAKSEASGVNISPPVSLWPSTPT
jgi:hypothetical protein